jgi:osmotically-inducible protein OsmY
MLVGVLVVACRRDETAERQGRPEMQPQPEMQAVESRDDRLTGEIRSKLYGDPHLAGGGSIVVLVHGGHVVLEGWVGSVNERTLAEADATTVAGVATVDDRLVVRQSPIVPAMPALDAGSRAD